MKSKTKKPTKADKTKRLVCDGVFGFGTSRDVPVTDSHRKLALLAGDQPDWALAQLIARSEAALSKDNRELRRESRKLRSALKALTKTCSEALRAIDHEMQKTSTLERGKAIASICNVLDMANDHARYFALGVDYRKDVKACLPNTGDDPRAQRE